jgi:cellulose synthase/poly-beta-1,6-N-acetylglucosamine synthase-like glycosyltransferase
MFDLIYLILIPVLSVYAWSIYNLPILVAGVKHLRRNRKKLAKVPSEEKESSDLPTFSIIVPVKNEEKVIGRLLDALDKLDYPAEKKEIIIVEDGSTDKSVDICEKHAEKCNLSLKVLHKPSSSGKPSALNYGIEHARGDIIGVFDADSLPVNDSLLNVCKYFEDGEVAAVQGRTLSINSEQNMLTKLISYEDAYDEVYLRGKDTLGLFVNLKGSCQFVRRNVLEKLKGFDEKTLCEDMEISARLTERGYKIRFAPDVRSWQESPADLKHLFRQRTRWYRGTIEVALKYGKLMAKLTRKSFDAEATLFGPFVLIASILTYFAAFYAVFIPFSISLLLQVIMQSTTLIVTLTIFLLGMALIYSSKPRKASNLKWIPFIYFYWSAQVFIALYALFLILLHKPRKWSKTEKTGAVNATFERTST